MKKKIYDIKYVKILKNIKKIRKRKLLNNFKSIQKLYNKFYLIYVKYYKKNLFLIFEFLAVNGNNTFQKFVQTNLNLINNPKEDYKNIKSFLKINKKFIDFDFNINLNDIDKFKKEFLNINIIGFFYKNFYNFYFLNFFFFLDFFFFFFEKNVLVLNSIYLNQIVLKKNIILNIVNNNSVNTAGLSVGHKFKLLPIIDFFKILLIGKKGFCLKIINLIFCLRLIIYRLIYFFLIKYILFFNKIYFIKKKYINL